MSFKDEINQIRREVLTQKTVESKPKEQAEDNKVNYLQNLLNERKNKSIKNNKPEEKQDNETKKTEEIQVEEKPVVDDVKTKEKIESKQDNIFTIEEIETLKNFIKGLSAKTEVDSDKGNIETKDNTKTKQETTETKPTDEESLKKNEQNELTEQFKKNRIQYDISQSKEFRMPIGDILAIQFDKMKIPQENRGLLKAAMMQNHGDKLSIENIEQITKETLGSFPILNQVNQLPTAYGSSKGDTSTKNYIGMNLAERREELIRNANS